MPAITAGGAEKEQHSPTEPVAFHTGGPILLVQVTSVKFSLGNATAEGLRWPETHANFALSVIWRPKWYGRTEGNDFLLVPKADLPACVGRRLRVPSPYTHYLFGIVSFDVAGPSPD